MSKDAVSYESDIDLSDGLEIGSDDDLPVYTGSPIRSPRSKRKTKPGERKKRIVASESPLDEISEDEIDLTSPSPPRSKKAFESDTSDTDESDTDESDTDDDLDMDDTPPPPPPPPPPRSVKSKKRVIRVISDSEDEDTEEESGSEDDLLLSDSEDDLSLSDTEDEINDHRPQPPPRSPQYSPTSPSYPPPPPPDSPKHAPKLAAKSPKYPMVGGKAPIHRKAPRSRGQHPRTIPKPNYGTSARAEQAVKVASEKQCPPYHLWDSDKKKCRLLIVGPLSRNDVENILETLDPKLRAGAGPMMDSGRWARPDDLNAVEGTNMIGMAEPHGEDEEARARFLVEHMGVTTLFNINDVALHKRDKNAREKKAFKDVCWHEDICSYNPVVIGRNDTRLEEEQRGRGVKDYVSTLSSDITDFIKYLDVDPSGKVSMHCTAGCGRTGHFVWSVLAYRNMVGQTVANPTSDETIEKALRLVGDKYNYDAADELNEVRYEKLDGPNQKLLKDQRIKAIRNALKDLFALARTDQLSETVQKNCAKVFEKYDIKTTRDWKRFIKFSTDSGAVQLVRECYLKQLHQQKLRDAMITEDEQKILMQYLPFMIYQKQRDLLRLRDGVVGRPCPVGRETVVVNTAKGRRKMCLKPCKPGHKRESVKLSGGRVRTRCKKVKVPKVPMGLTGSQVKKLQPLVTQMQQYNSMLQKVMQSQYDHDPQVADRFKKVVSDLRQRPIDPNSNPYPPYLHGKPRSDILAHIKEVRKRLKLNLQLVRSVVNRKTAMTEGLPPSLLKTVNKSKQVFERLCVQYTDALKLIDASPWPANKHISTLIGNLDRAFTNALPMEIIEKQPKGLKRPVAGNGRLHVFFTKAFDEYEKILRTMWRPTATIAYKVAMARMRSGIKMIEEARDAAPVTLRKAQYKQITAVLSQYDRIQAKVKSMVTSLNKLVTNKYDVDALYPAFNANELTDDIAEDLIKLYRETKSVVAGIHVVVKTSAGAAFINPEFDQSVLDLMFKAYAARVKMDRARATKFHAKLKQTLSCELSGKERVDHVIRAGKRKGQIVKKCVSKTLPPPLPRKLKSIIKRSSNLQKKCASLAEKHKDFEYVREWLDTLSDINDRANDRLSTCGEATSSLVDGCEAEETTKFTVYAQTQLDLVTRQLRKRAQQHLSLQKPCGKGKHREIVTRKKVKGKEVRVISRVQCVKDGSVPDLPGGTYV